MLNIYGFEMSRFLAIMVMGLAALCATTLAQSSTSLTDRDVVWDTRTLPLADAITAVEATVGLAPYRELIIDGCGLHSVNPKLIALLLEMNDTLADSTLTNVAAKRERIDAFIMGVARINDVGRAQAVAAAKTLPSTDALPPASRAESSGINAVAETFVSGDARLQSLSARYVER